MSPQVSHDLLSFEARERLEHWPARARSLFLELLEDAPSELQREFLQRAVAAGHTASEVHAFADALRGLSDAEAFVACTLEANAPDGYTVVQLLRAEADPLYAYELKGGELSPNEELDFEERKEVPSAEVVLPPAGDPAWMKPLAHARENSGVRPNPFGGNDLGVSGDVPSLVHRRTGTGSFEVPRDGGLLGDQLNDATRGLAVTWRETQVDGDQGTPLEQLLEPMVAALQRGAVVPIAVGPSQGYHRRFAVVLQFSQSSKARAFQLYDPFAHELVWASEGTLLSRTELPFNDKANRRITWIALPTAPSTGF